MNLSRKQQTRAVLAATLLLASSVASTAYAASWKVDPEKSKLGFSGIQTQVPFQGSFGRYSAAINFDPEHLDTSHISVTVDLASAATGDSQRDSALPGKEWFHTAEFPNATFESSAIRALGGNAYEA